MFRSRYKHTTPESTSTFTAAAEAGRTRFGQGESGRPLGWTHRAVDSPHHFFRASCQALSEVAVNVQRGQTARGRRRSLTHREVLTQATWPGHPPRTFTPFPGVTTTAKVSQREPHDGLHSWSETGERSRRDYANQNRPQILFPGDVYRGRLPGPGAQHSRTRASGACQTRSQGSPGLLRLRLGGGHPVSE